MTYREAKEKAVSWANNNGAPEFAKEDIAVRIENKDTFAFVERIPDIRLSDDSLDYLLISPRV